MGAMKEHYDDPAFAGDATKLRAGFGAEYDAHHKEQTTAAIDKLNDQIELEKSLAAVQAQGAEAVRLVTLAYKLRQMVAGYQVSQRKRKRIEEVFGWVKTVGMLRKTRHRGLETVAWVFTFTATAYNLVRMRNLMSPAFQPA
jgi:hypothetical protein